MGAKVDIPVAFTAIYKGFKDSPIAGFASVRHTVDDAVTHFKERNGNAYFRNPLDIKINSTTGQKELFWPGYDRSISDSLRRNAALLRLHGASKEQYEKAKTEWKLWKDNLEPTILNLQQGTGIQFLALRWLEVEQGVALQQISNKDGQLLLESQLLPFGQLTEVESFQQLLSEQGEDISLQSESNDVDNAVGWLVQGPVIDFQGELPRVIEQVRQPAALSEVMSITMPLPEITNQSLVEQLVVPGRMDSVAETARSVSEVAGFWFESPAVAAIATPDIIETPVSVFEETTRFNLEGQKESMVALVTSGLGPEVTVTEEPTRLNLVGVEPPVTKTTKTVFVGPKTIETVIQKQETPVYIVVVKGEPFKSESTFLYSDSNTKKLLAEKEEPMKQSKLRVKDSVPVLIRTEKGKIVKIILSQSNRAAQTLKHSDIDEGKVVSSAVIPEWKISLKALNDKEIPLWQMSLTGAEEDFTTLMLAMFFLIVNTKWLQNDNLFISSRGSGQLYLR